jgi:hypothetical protein
MGLDASRTAEVAHGIEAALRSKRPGEVPCCRLAFAGAACSSCQEEVDRICSCAAATPPPRINCPAPHAV